MQKPIVAGVKNPVTGHVAHQHGTNGAQHFIAGVLDSTGKFVPLESCKLTEYENADGTLNYIEAQSYDGRVWRQSFSYNATNPKRVTSAWVPQ